MQMLGEPRRSLLAGAVGRARVVGHRALLASRRPTFALETSHSTAVCCC